MLSIDDYPQLSLLAWNRKERLLSEAEAFALYEANPQWVDRDTMGERERALLDELLLPTDGVCGMVERGTHRRVLTLLSWLDVDFLREAGCWFAGDTAVSLRCGEFRVSRDVDFLCATQEGYRALRNRVHHQGLRGFFTRDVEIVREVRADRYGIRAVVRVAETPLKIEFVNEGRIALEGTFDPDLPVARLTDQDLVAEKLLANADRFLDDSSLARDVLDLLLLAHHLGGLPDAAWQKARGAYGDSVDSAFARALQRLRDRPDLVERAFKTLDMRADAQEVVAARLSTIARSSSEPPTSGPALP